MSKNALSASNNGWPAEPTLENFREQADSLDNLLRAEAEMQPHDQCENIAEYVKTFYWSGSAQMHACLQLSQAGYHALASPEGVQWLRKTYPPA